VKRKLGKTVPLNLQLSNISDADVALPGVLTISGPKWSDYEQSQQEFKVLKDQLSKTELDEFPLIVLCDDAHFTAANVNNFVWVTFTRANPSHDIEGVDSFIEYKHWGCNGPLIIDARIKKHHAPELIPDVKVVQKVDKLFSKGGELYGKL
jgi:4-hydroxy-3-polyprenylbenzoate decarboxylase